MNPMRRCAGCGQRLNRYNPAEHCHACSRAAAGVTVETPPAVLFDSAVRRALAAGDWATVLRAIARETGASQTAIATATGLSQPHVSRLMNGRSREPGIRTVRALCDGLGIPRALAGLAPAPADDVEEDATDRRTFLASSMGAALLGVAAPVRDAKVAHAGATEVQQLHTAARDLQRLDRLHGADSLCEVSVRCLRRADQWLNFASYSSDVGRELQVAYATLAQITGWLYYDAGRQSASRHYYREALGAAQLAGDTELEVRVLSAMSMQAAYVGRPREAVQLAQRARERAAGWATPRVQSLLLAREAIGWARCGDHGAFRRRFIAASNAFDPRPSRDDPYWIGFFDEAEFTGLNGLALSHLRSHDRAVPLLRGASGLRAGDELRRNRVSFQALLAHQYLKLDDVTRACDTMERDLSVMADVNSTRVRKRIEGVCRALARTGRARARELVDRAGRLGVVTV